MDLKWVDPLQRTVKVDGGEERRKDPPKEAETEAKRDRGRAETGATRCPTLLAVKGERGPAGESEDCRQSAPRGSLQDCKLAARRPQSKTTV